MAIGSREEHASVETLARTFRYLFAAQLLSRGITFLFNTWIVRHLDEEDLALYAVKFHVFLTVVMLSREGIRRACMRVDTKSSEGGQFEASIAKLLRIAWCTPVIGLLFVFATCTFCFRSQSLNYSDPFGWAIIIFGFACMLELLAEPLYIFSQNLLLLKLRLRVETIATFLRCLTTYILISKKPNMIPLRKEFCPQNHPLSRACRLRGDHLLKLLGGNNRGLMVVFTSGNRGLLVPCDRRRSL